MAETTSETHTEVGAEPAEKKPFPPFDATTFMPQLFWLAITFTLLYIVLERSLLPRIAGVIGDRRTRITGDLQEAERLRREADAALKAYEKAMAEARAQAVGIGADARAVLKAEIDKRKAEIDAELSRQLEAAEAAIARAKNDALGGVRAVAVDVAAAIVEKVLHERPVPAELSRAVDEELAA